MAWFDPGQTLYELGNGPSGIDQGLKGVDYLRALKLHRTHFNDAIPVQFQPGGFQVEGYMDQFERSDRRDTQSHGR